MDFRTEITGIQGDRSIDYKASVFLIGSCFSQEIGEKLSHFQFNTLSNPFGVIFHPLAIERLLRDSIEETNYGVSDLIEHEGLWCSLFHHSQFNRKDPEWVIQKLNQGRKNTTEFLKRSTHVFITLGTSWVYRWQESGEIVANCHKIPQKQFDKILLSLEELSNSLTRTIKMIHQLNPAIKIVFTVSPIRHLRDGFRENQISKSQLHLAIESNMQHANTFYFPAYEIVQDDLRDYRFYTDDMLHPSPKAVDYIWTQLYTHWFSSSCDPIIKKVDSINRSLAHRPNHPDSEKHLDLLKRTQKAIEDLQSRYPHMTWEVAN